MGGRGQIRKVLNKNIKCRGGLETEMINCSWWEEHEKSKDSERQLWEGFLEKITSELDFKKCQAVTVGAGALFR